MGTLPNIYELNLGICSTKGMAFEVFGLKKGMVSAPSPGQHILTGINSEETIFL